MLARFRLLLLVLLLSLPQLAWSETLFVSPQQVDLARLLPPPPAMDSAEQRDEVFEDLQGLVAAGEIAMGVGRAEVGEIETLNILGATKLAMRRAMEQIYPPEVFRQREEPDLFSGPEALATFQPTVNCRVLIDGLKLRGFPYPHEGVVHGDARSLCIAMASIAAKVTRDRAMIALDGEYPGYGVAAHKGYGTEDHREALLRQGRCFQHRDKFVRSFLEGKRHDVAGQLGLFGELEPENQ